MPIFKPELIEKILAGQKTQTRRPIRDGDDIYIADIPDVRHAFKRDGMHVYVPQDRLGEVIVNTVLRNGRRHWEVGRDYALIPGRAKPAVPGYRIRITRIRREDVRDISHEDAVAEGFSDKYGFLYTWCSFYDPKMAERILYDASADPLLPDWCPQFLRSRPDDLYQAWALDFTLMRTGEAKPVVTPPMW